MYSPQQENFDVTALATDASTPNNIAILAVGGGGGGGQHNAAGGGGAGGLRTIVHLYQYQLLHILLQLVLVVLEII